MANSPDTLGKGYMARIIPAQQIVPVVKADSDLTFGPCRALWVGTAGTLNIQQLDGTVRAGFPAQVGLIPVSVKQVRLGGTADNIWALY